MLLNQYGGMKGVQEIRGLISLYNPIGIISVLFFIIGVWIPFKNKKINKIFGGLGVVGIVISEIYNFFTWHIMNITGKMSIHNSIEFAFPEFYVGLVISLIMIAVYFCIDKIPFLNFSPGQDCLFSGPPIHRNTSGRNRFPGRCKTRR